MKIIIMHETVTNHDAIGNDVECMYRFLSKNNQCYVYAVNKNNSNVEFIDYDELLKLITDNNNIIIYHHSVNWIKGMEILKMAKCRLIIRYHNITPEKFFYAFSKIHYDICSKGRVQTLELQKKFPDAYWLCASEYNAEDVCLLPDSHIGICPPFNKVEEWGYTNPDHNILEELNSNKQLKLLFVGRIAPNKGHMLMLEVLRHYIYHYDKNVKLRIIGKFDLNLHLYNDLVLKRIKDYQLEDNVEIIGEINDESLIAYYKASDIFLCCSEHEGFCVPVVEAQFFGLPIVALNTCAVPETIGGNQVLLSKDPAEIAAAIKVIYDSKDIAKFLIEEGKRNYRNRFSLECISEKFEKELKKAFTPQPVQERVDIEKIMKGLKKAAQEERYVELLNIVRAEIEKRGLINDLPDFEGCQ